MLDKNKITNKEIERKFRNARVHALNIQSAISDTSSCAVNPKDWRSLHHFIKECKSRKNDYWTKEGPNAPFIQAIVTAYDTFKDVPNPLVAPYRSSGKEINRPNDDQDLINNRIGIDTILNQLNMLVLILETIDQTAYLAMLNAALISANNIIDVMIEAGDSPVAETDMDTLKNVIKFHQKHHFTKKSARRRNFIIITENFRCLQVDATGLIIRAELGNSTCLDNIVGAIRTLIDLTTSQNKNASSMEKKAA
jgi:hypothetical protein